MSTDQDQRTVLGMDPFQGSNEEPKAHRVDEGDALQVDHQMVVPCPDEVHKPLPQHV